MFVEWELRGYRLRIFCHFDVTHPRMYIRVCMFIAVYLFGRRLFLKGAYVHLFKICGWLGSR